ncbi:hypothetical protein, partial [Lysinibacillus sp. GbtcB16]|uniref:hypothetical protein n=1 Tax=Lysinibacillus sp. GbtcB16 TaxID=2824761 RepID=UPI001C30CDE8
EQILQARVDLRTRAAKSKRIPHRDELPALAEQDLTRLSDLQIALYREFFGLSGELDYAAIQTSLELYGNRELQSTKYPGHLQPDTARVF